MADWSVDIDNDGGIVAVLDAILKELIRLRTLVEELNESRKEPAHEPS